MSLVAGIDLSTFALDICLLQEDVDLATHYRRRLDIGGGDALTRTRRIRDAMPARGLWRDEVVAVGIERPFARNQGGGHALQLALGAILACLPPELDLLMLRADDWRRTCELPIRGARDEHKRASKRFALAHWADHPATFDDNAADAFCIAFATRSLVEQRQAAA